MHRWRIIWKLFAAASNSLSVVTGCRDTCFQYSIHTKYTFFWVADRWFHFRLGAETSGNFGPRCLLVGMFHLIMRFSAIQKLRINGFVWSSSVSGILALIIFTAILRIFVAVIDALMISYATWLFHKICDFKCGQIIPHWEWKWASSTVTMGPGMWREAWNEAAVVLVLRKYP